MSEQEMSIQDKHVVSMDYLLLVEGEKIDSSEEDGPIQFIQGEGHIISGLGDALYGMKIGEKKEVLVEAKDGYGEYDATLIKHFDISEFPESFIPEEGMVLETEDEDGEVILAEVLSVVDEKVRLDFNHPLAGKNLQFTITIRDIRKATKQELENGLETEEE